MDKGKNLELNSVNKEEPVKVVKREGDMIPARLSGYYSGPCIQKRLEGERRTFGRPARRELQ